MNEVRLYGHLRKFGKSFNYDISTPYEAVSALKATIPGFAQHVAKYNKPGYLIVIGKEVIDPTKHMGLQTRKIIKIVPVVEGSGGAIGTIAGIALLFVAPEFAAFSAIGGSIATSIGVSLVLGGLSSMLSGSPDSKPTGAAATNNPSASFNGAVNLTTQGNPVPVAYGGPMIVGSQLISGGLSAEQV